MGRPGLLRGARLAGFLVLVAYARAAPTLAGADDWGTHLRESLKACDVSVIVDLETLGKARPLPMPKTPSVEALRRLGWMLSRDLSPCGDAWVMRRRTIDPTQHGAQPSAELLEWLMGASSDELGPLLDSSVEFDALSGMGQRACALVAMLNAGLSERVASGRSVRVSVGFSRRMVFQHPATGKVMNLDLAMSDWPRTDDLGSAEVTSQDVAVSPLRAAGGELDFGAGTLMTLGELIAKVQMEFRASVIVDQRLLGARVFAKGTFNRPNVLEAIVAISETAQPKVVEWTRTEKSAALRSLLEGPGASRLTDEDRAFARGGKTTLGDLAARYPAAANYLRQYGLDASLEVSRGYGMAITLAAEGSSPSLHGSGSRNGVPVRAMEPNRVSFVITP